jgi:hypothetical protein
MIRRLFIAAVLVYVCNSQSQIVVCDGCIFNPFNRTVAFNDSLNAAYPDDADWGGSLGAAVRGSGLCFIGHVQSIRQCPVASEFTETLTVVCDTQINGPALPGRFDVLNKYQRLSPNGNDCLAPAQGLGAQKFLCMLVGTTVPRQLTDMGVYMGRCGSQQGTFVTGGRIVKFVSQCSSHTNSCWDTPVFADLKAILDITEVKSTADGRIAQTRFVKSSHESRMYDVSGRLVRENSRHGVRLVIKNEKLRLILEK